MARSLIFEGNRIPLLTYEQLNALSASDLASKSDFLTNVIGGARLPPPPEDASDEARMIWILQVEVALAHGQNLRCAFGEPVTPELLGVPGKYIEGAVDQPPATEPPATPQPSGAA